MTSLKTWLALSAAARGRRRSPIKRAMTILCRLNKKSSTAVNYITGLESFKAVLAKITGALGG